MEIQGLSDVQNIHSQHGALHRTASSPLRPVTGSLPHFIFTDNEADRPQEPAAVQIDTNSTRPKTSPFRLSAENGSDVVSFPARRPRSVVSSSSPDGGAGLGLHNVNAEKESGRVSLPCSPELVRTAWRSEESGGAAMQMALPLSEGEEEPLTSPVLRQQREDGAPKQPPAVNHCAANRTDRPAQELYVVFNVVQGDGPVDAGRQQPDGSPAVKGKKAERSKKSRSMEVADGSPAVLCESHDKLNCLDTQTSKKEERTFSTAPDNSAVVDAKPSAYPSTVEDVVLTNKYGDKICGQICTEGRGLSSQSPALTPETAGVVEAMDTSGFISDSRGLQGSASPAAASAGPPAAETFSGTITINNQSIIVTIENGILTLAAPPEGHVRKEDDMISLKEHLGMKDHEDIVLLNYDSGTKSIGKISTLALTGPSQQEEPRTGLSVSDSELALVDDCSLSELGTSLDSCPTVKQEAGVLCAVTEADLVNPSPKATVPECDSEEVNSAPLIRSKKDTVATFSCPEPDCSCIFGSRQKLKVHLLNHAEDPRPYQCTVEGCGWAFATSYKLKRHLQSHDKQRPHTCQFEGCGRRFTTVYNLKAHVKVHEQDNAFICEICSERFRSATRLANHQRVHFEPQRPHKCEFPGCEKTFITFSALFSHNRTHFRETGHFSCTYPGCDKTYDKACRLKIHMRSHTDEIEVAGSGSQFTMIER